ncbi:carbohydrate ABC transporter permease [Microbacterium sp. A94]|uniref:carbohydrate ABC transporter permease n=1 Tax=Microbacterium sp. A94 TaxID=3450717 RepID=UPI003F428741
MTRSTRSVHRRASAGVYLVLIAVSLLALFPMLAVLLGSFRSDADIIRDPIGWPTSFNMDNYIAAWGDASLGLYFLNSVGITVAALVLATALALPAAYALGRWVFPGRDVVMAGFLIGLMVPLKIGIVPLNQAFDRLGLIDTHLGLVLVYAVGCIPMTILVLSTFYRQLPNSLEEAAVLDGATSGRIFFSVMTPLVRPALAAVLVLNVGPVWNDFFMPLVLLRSDEKYTIPVGITKFFGEHSAERGLLYAGIIIAVLPVAIFFALAMKQIVGGLTAGIEK